MTHFKVGDRVSAKLWNIPASYGEEYYTATGIVTESPTKNGFVRVKCDSPEFIGYWSKAHFPFLPEELTLIEEGLNENRS